MTVIGSILQHPLDIPLGATRIAAQSQSAARKPLTDVNTAWQRGAQAALSGASAGSFKYESRVMQGIWATAPYLHNGSVPTLADLLKPDSPAPRAVPGGALLRPGECRPRCGPARCAGARDTGCEARNSGNSRCGHNFGTNMSAADKKALLEYLKTL